MSLVVETEMLASQNTISSSARCHNLGTHAVWAAGCLDYPPDETDRLLAAGESLLAIAAGYREVAGLKENPTIAFRAQMQHAYVGVHRENAAGQPLTAETVLATHERLRIIAKETLQGGQSTPPPRWVLERLSRVAYAMLSSRVAGCGAADFDQCVLAPMYGTDLDDWPATSGRTYPRCNFTVIDRRLAQPFIPAILAPGKGSKNRAQGIHYASLGTILSAAAAEAPNDVNGLSGAYITPFSVEQLIKEAGHEPLDPTVKEFLDRASAGVIAGIRQTAESLSGQSQQETPAE